jgi:hypothetical protein
MLFSIFKEPITFQLFELDLFTASVAIRYIFMRLNTFSATATAVIPAEAKPKLTGTNTIQDTNVKIQRFHHSCYIPQ